MKSLTLTGCVLLFLVVGLTGCASMPGETGAEQVETIDALVERTLADLYLKEPKTKEEITNSAGYVVASTKVTKIPFVGAGSGYGIGIEYPVPVTTVGTRPRANIDSPGEYSASTTSGLNLVKASSQYRSLASQMSASPQRVSKSMSPNVRRALGLIDRSTTRGIRRQSS